MEEKIIMKRFAALVIVIFLTVGLLFVIPGCADNSLKAEEYMQAGDRYLDKARENNEAMEELAGEINEIIMAIFSDQVPSSVTVQEKTDEYKKLSTTMLQETDKAKNEYQKILDLNEDNGYTEYAELAIERIDTFELLFGAYGSMMEYIVETLEQRESGANVDGEAFSQSLQ